MTLESIKEEMESITDYKFAIEERANDEKLYLMANPTINIAIRRYKKHSKEKSFISVRHETDDFIWSRPCNTIKEIAEAVNYIIKKSVNC